MFSVVIPLYNKAEYIKRAIDSVLAQDYMEFECIVVDDGSTDNSVDIVRSYTNDKLKLLCQPNSGVSAARNRGIREASYEWIAFLDADDEWLPFHLSDILPFTKTDIYMVTTNCILLPSQGHHCGVKELPAIVDYFSASLRNRCTIANSSSTAVKSEAFEIVGYFDENLRYSEDRDMWNRIASLGLIGYVSRPSARYYDVDNSVTKGAIIPFETVTMFLSSFDRIQLIPNISLELQANHAAYVGFLTMDRIAKSMYTHHCSLPGHLALFLIRRFISSRYLRVGLWIYLRTQMPAYAPRLCRLLVTTRNTLRRLLSGNPK